MSASPYSSRGSAEPPTLVNTEAGTATQGRLYDQVFGEDDDEDNDNDNAEETAPAAEAETGDADSANAALAGEGAETAEQSHSMGDIEAALRAAPAPADDVDEDRDEDDDTAEAAPARAMTSRDEDRDEDDDEDEPYQPGSSTARPSKLPSFKKKKRDADMDEDEDRDEDDDDEDAERRRKQKRKEKKEKRARRDRAPEDVDEDDVAEAVLTGEELRRKMVNDRIDNIGKKVKIPRKKKKSDEDVDSIDTHQDDVCARLRDRMAHAAETDARSVEKKQAATAKLAMLDEVMQLMRNTTYWQSVIDNGVLEAVRMWLEPIPPVGALPAVGIQKAIFEVLPKMDLDTQTLKECRLGPIVLFYTRAKRVTPEISRQADSLVQAWSRPIIKRPANLRSRHVQSASEAILEPRRERGVDGEDGEGDGLDGVEDAVAPRATITKKRRFDAMAAMRDNEGRKGARLFNTRDMQYTVAPESQAIHRKEDMVHVERIKNDNAKFNKFARQMKAKK